MSEPPLATPILVASQIELAKMMQELAKKRLIALDTESDSLYSYYSKVCLVQISAYADTTQCEIVDYLVDPLALDDLSPLAQLLSLPDYELIIHAAENDLLLLRREFDITVKRIFDTQLAARILGRKKVGLAAILDEEFGIVSNKRMQRTDWGKRPLTPEQIIYAQKDTHFLLSLRETLKAELKDAGRWQEAQESFRQLVEIDFASKETPARTMWQMKETRSVAREDLGLLEALWEWREMEAQRRDTPPFKVMRNQALLEMTLERPSTIDGLLATQSVGKTNVRRYGKQLLKVIEEGQRRPAPDLPDPVPRTDYSPDKKIQSLYDSLRKWRTQTANARGVAPEIVMANGTLMEIAKQRPRSISALLDLDDIGPWRAETYGPAILKIVNRSGQ